MRVSILALVTVLSVSCKFQHITSGEKRLQGGDDVLGKLSLKEAQKVVKQRCGGVLAKTRWMAMHDETTGSDGVFVSETKEGIFGTALLPKIACRQTVLIDELAVRYLAAHNVTCSKSPDAKQLQIVVSGANLSRIPIKVDCATKFVSMSYRKTARGADMLDIATIEADGAVEMASVENGIWSGEIKKFAGVSSAELLSLEMQAHTYKLPTEMRDRSREVILVGTLVTAAGLAKQGLTAAGVLAAGVLSTGTLLVLGPIALVGGILLYDKFKQGGDADGHMLVKMTLAMITQSVKEMQTLDATEEAATD